MCWDSDPNAPAPANLSNPEACTRVPTANDLHPLPQDALLAESCQTSPVSELGFSHHAQRTKAIPEGAGKRIRAQRAGTAPTKTGEQRGAMAVLLAGLTYFLLTYYCGVAPVVVGLFGAARRRRLKRRSRQARGQSRPVEAAPARIKAVLGG